MQPIEERKKEGMEPALSHGVSKQLIIHVHISKLHKHCIKDDINS
jgi:hypothetical protein